VSSAVLDASALLALLMHEPGTEVVALALATQASMSTVNLAEVVGKLADRGMPETAVRATIDSVQIDVVDFDSDLAYSSGMLRPVTKQAGLSLGDRACLSLARRLGLEVLTADRTWSDLALDVAVRLIR
jgi:ribonuclease VapC